MTRVLFCPRLCDVRCWSLATRLPAPPGHGSTGHGQPGHLGSTLPRVTRVDSAPGTRHACDGLRDGRVAARGPVSTEPASQHTSQPRAGATACAASGQELCRADAHADARAGSQISRAVAWRWWLTSQSSLSNPSGTVTTAGAPRTTLETHSGRAHLALGEFRLALRQLRPHALQLLRQRVHLGVKGTARAA